MSYDRRQFLADTGKFLLLTGAAGEAWAFIEAGRPQDAPGYDVTRHWWAMFIDVEKCIGCGKCVEACKLENDVPDDPHFFRTWVERYHIPARDVTKLAFGGPDLSTAFVTTAIKNMTGADMAQMPLSGSLFTFPAPVAGVAQTLAKLG